MSRGFSTKEKKEGGGGDGAAAATNMDNSWYLSERVLRASENAKQMRKRIEMNSMRSAEIAVKPIVFDFSNPNYQFSNGGSRFGMNTHTGGAGNQIFKR